MAKGKGMGTGFTGAVAEEVTLISADGGEVLPPSLPPSPSLSLSLSLSLFLSLSLSL